MDMEFAIRLQTASQDLRRYVGGCSAITSRKRAALWGSERLAAPGQVA